MLGRRRGQRANIDPTLVQCLVLAGSSISGVVIVYSILLYLEYKIHWETKFTQYN